MKFCPIVCEPPLALVLLILLIHYRKAIKPDFNGPGGKDINVGGEKGTEILQRLQVNIRPELFPKPGGAYLTVNTLGFVLIRKDLQLLTARRTCMRSDLLNSHLNGCVVSDLNKTESCIQSIHYPL